MRVISSVVGVDIVTMISFRLRVSIYIVRVIALSISPSSPILTTISIRVVITALSTNIIISSPSVCVSAGGAGLIISTTMVVISTITSVTTVTVTTSVASP